MQYPKKLIEVAMPVKEVSAESVRDKSIRHGHISTLHLWWARRPLPVCRAVVFASLVPDPMDENCPEAFKDAVEILLGPENNPTDPYRPYQDIPSTSAVDAMEDNLRNRLLMYIGKFSNEYLNNEKLSKKTPAKTQLSDFSLIKWDNKNNTKIISKAQKLIWVAHNSEQQRQAGKPESTVHELLSAFDKAFQAIETAQEQLYETVNRHQNTPEAQAKETALQQAIDDFQDSMPRVFDPFAGGGAIPLEAARLGCRTYANDLNPVAHIIEKGSLEFPQKFGKPIRYTENEFCHRYGDNAMIEYQDKYTTYKDNDTVIIQIPNRLAFDVAFYAKKLLKLAEKEIGHYYPANEKGQKPVAYYWARVAKCSNPSCGAEVPLLKQYYLVNKGNKKVYLDPIIDGTHISFEIKTGTTNRNGWNERTNLKCPCCGNITDSSKLKAQFKAGKTSEKLLAIIWEGSNGKEYRLPQEQDLEIISSIPTELDRPHESMEVGNNRNFNTPGWGISQYGQMFSQRQLLMLSTLVLKLTEIKEELNTDELEYEKALLTYLGILIDRIAIINTSFGRLHIGRETLEHPFSKQAIPMIFDYPESNPFCSSTGSAFNQLDWITRYIESENHNTFFSQCTQASSGERNQFSKKYLNAVITDPPYYDAIAYADLSDFFYVWLKRTILEIYPINFATPQTPKAEECTALKHHHGNSFESAKNHFEHKLQSIFDAIELQTSEIVSIMFAHQSTEAWTTLCNSILKSRMNITGSWAIDTEMASRTLALGGAALASSVTVSCRPIKKQGYGDFMEIREAVKIKVKDEVNHLYKLGFRGVDLLTACFGQAVSEFGKYEQVEKPDGTLVTVAELLELARAAAFNAIVSDIATDDFTKFYIGWLHLFGFSPTEHDTVRRITQIGLNIDVNDLQKHHILIQTGNTESLADCGQRVAANNRLGQKETSFTIDKVHQAMYLFQQSNRIELTRYISAVAASPESDFWRVLNSLQEILPSGMSDYKYASGLLTNKDNLIRDARKVAEQIKPQLDLDI